MTGMRGHPCRCPSWSGAVAEGRSGQQVMWDVAHPCPWLGPACPAVFLSACPAHSGRAAHPDSSPAASCLHEEMEKKESRRRMKEPEVNRYLNAFLCVSAAPPPPARERPQRLTPTSCGKPATTLSLCVHWVGVGMRSLRPELGVWTKGERRDHSFKAREDKGPSRKSGDRILIYCLR